jgi:hypothetical protein
MSAQPDDPAAPPTYSQCVLGYRAWDADAEGRLWPISDRRGPWVPGVNTARCNCEGVNSMRLEWSSVAGRRRLEAVPEHDAPAAGCECGLYSWRRPRHDWSDVRAGVTPPRIVGAIASWGLLHVHDDGFRAEHACVVTLAYRADIDAGSFATLASIASTYRADLVPLAELERAAAKHGAPLGEDVRPAPAKARTAELEELPRPSPRSAPDARPEDVGIPIPLGFDGRPLKRSGLAFGGGGVAGA